MPLTIGDTFAGYRVLRLLGSGGMGEVYSVQHPRLPRQEALKVLRPEFSQDESFRERFTREADLASGLRHPHIVGIHDRGEHDGLLWIAMDYIEGTDLGQLLDGRYPQGLPVGHVLTVVAAVASALDYAHKKGLLHRDVKPANIIVADLDTDDPKIFLADFGIARPLNDTSSITTTNMTVGTVAYAAPEQLMGEPMNGKADQYALAATTYHLLTGSQLFPNSNPAVVIGRHLSTTPPSLGDERPDLAVLDAPVRQALEKSPEDRHATCAAFALAVRGASISTASQQATTLAPVTARPHRVPNLAEGRKTPPVTKKLSPPAPPPVQLQDAGVRQAWPIVVGTLVAVALVGGAAVALVSRPWEHTGAETTTPAVSRAVTGTTSMPTSFTVSTRTPTATAGPTSAAWSYAGLSCPYVPALTLQTAQSVVVICDEGTGIYTYKGLRLKDNARIDLPGVVATPTGFSVTNDDTRYDISRNGLVIYTGGDVYAEPAISSGP
ncbi:serine/threonine-protein kinase [Mycolicibacterium diernhoferi]|uniref:non-specific serine/threonine protein kinase n=1 Tax=Mycolicibacterium diernhoferi TaxID=1801 RepID=A0A1Q4H944_9MYCO|nr:serine/threonine-protein kinase [Mycolicibacterium diernhoferi]OJZ64037.1 hypothetical protein BRW64_20135 [Mycolicibacterium diernhoferi]OPE53767.1 hypothetical protein BV510_13865 [Mycolicibacterium diernhoferi]PEG55577.1 serine/threonine protein kinase [Mycolicibacterium diernhoferi]QYL20725.1 serine/threonine protein kinase [Mycolicibacterium diernhoferi]